MRCQCGQILVVPGQASHAQTVRTIHCANCGGQLKKGDPNCPYCGALVDLTHAALTAYCPACLSMSKAGAKFCSGCGKPLVQKLDAPSEAAQTCPHCQVQMRNRQLGDRHALECPMCCGLFIDVHVLDHWVEQLEKQPHTPVRPPGTEPERALLTAQPVIYVKCPICGTVMNRLNFGRISGVIVDYCREHGYWLDNGELEKIAKWVTTGGLAKQRTRAAEEEKAKKNRLPMTDPMANPMTGDSPDLFGRSASTSVGKGVLEVIFKLFG